MQLQEFIKTLPKDKQIRIGMNAGSKFVYMGSVRDFSATATDNEIRRDICRKINTCVDKITVRTRPAMRVAHARAALNHIAKLESLESVADKEVVETYAGLIEPDSLVIIVEGDIDGKDYSPDCGKLAAVKISDEAAELLTSAIYREPAKNLTAAYLRWLVAKEKGDTGKASRAKEAADGLTNLIMEIPYLGKERNEGIVRECLIRAKKEFKEWRKKNGVGKC